MGVIRNIQTKPEGENAGRQVVKDGEAGDPCGIKSCVQWPPNRGAQPHTQPRRKSRQPRGLQTHHPYDRGTESRYSGTPSGAIRPHPPQLQILTPYHIAHRQLQNRQQIAIEPTWSGPEDDVGVQEAGGQSESGVLGSVEHKKRCIGHDKWIAL